MKRFLRFLLLLILISTSPILVRAVSFTFSAPTRTACDTPAVFNLFASATGCSSGVSYRWTISNGSTTITSTTGRAIVLSSFGAWNVHVVAYCGTDSAVLDSAAFLTVNPRPTIAITSTSLATDTGLVCPTHTVQFVNASTADTTCSGTSWTWAISGPTGTTFYYTYNPPPYSASAPGTYSVSLFFRNNCVCFGSATVSNYFTIDVPPTACFTRSDSVFCNAGATVHDTALCSTGAFSYLWHFSDGTTSTSPIADHYLGSPGYYNDTLFAYSRGGCVDRAIRVRSVFVGNFRVTVRADRDTVCENACINFYDSTLGGRATSHTFSLYQGSTLVTSTSGYPGAFCFTGINGSFRVVDVVTDSLGCSATNSVNVFVRSAPVIDSFVADTLYKCVPNLTAHFVATASSSASGALTYTWAFSSAATATFTGTGTTGARPTFTYTASGTYNPRLVVTDIRGCTDTLTRTGYIAIGAARVSISKDLDSFCIGRTVHFRIDASPTAASLNLIVDTVAFGDSSAPCIGAACADSAHTFTRSGTRYIAVTSHLPASLGGCIYHDTTWVKIGDAHAIMAPVISPNDSVCPQTTVAFQANCTNCTWYKWHFTSPDGGSDAEGPPPTYDTTSSYYGIVPGTPPGRYAWRLSVSVNGCSDTLNDTILVYGPRKGTITPIHDCRVIDSFTLTLSGTLATTTNRLGKDSIRYWYDAPTLAAAMSGSGLFAVTTGNAGTVVRRRFSAGWHTIWVKEYGVPHYESSIGRMDTCDVWTDSVRFFVGRDTVRLTSTDTVICVGETVTLVGPHQADGSTFNGYDFFSGESTTHTGEIADSNYTFTYASRGTFMAWVRVRNSSGCFDTSNNIRITVIGPTGGMTVSPDTVLCVGDLFTFRDNNTTTSPYSIVRRRWSEGTTTLGLATPLIRSFSEGYHTITLNDTDNSPHGCNVSQNIRIHAVKPHAYFTSDDSVGGLCPNISICFHDTNTRCRYSWDFGDGAGFSAPTFTSQDTCHTYGRTGTFTVRCAIYSDGTGGFPSGCADTFTRTNFIRAGGIRATSTNLGDGDSVACPPLRLIRFGDTLSYSYTWIVRKPSSCGGGVDTFRGSILNTALMCTGTYTVTMIGSSPRGCADSQVYYYFIGGPTGRIALSDTSGCAPDSIRFSFINTGVALTSTYIWDVCPFGSFTTTGDTTFIFSTPGTYCPPTLTIQSGGCVTNISNITDSIRIYPVPTVSISGGGMICFGAAANLVASGADYYTWSPMTNLAFTSGDSVTKIAPGANPTVTTTYVATGYTTFGCVDTESVTVFVDPPIHLTISGKDSVCIGQCDTLVAGGLPRGTLYVWTGTGVSCAVCDTNVICITSTKTFKVKATDAAGCSDSTFKKVTINPTPVLRVTPDPVHVCAGTPKPVTITGAASYLWRPRVGIDCDTCSSVNFTTPSNLIYSVVGTTIHGCKDSITVPVVVYDSIPTSISDDTSICRGDYAQLVATAGIKFRWVPSQYVDNPSSYRPRVNPIANTVYTVYITENECFMDTLTVFVRVVQLPQLKLPPDVTLIAGQSYQLYATYGDSANHSYLTHFMWTPADSTLTCSTCPRPIATPTATTTYSVIATTIEGCAGTGHVTITLLCDGSQVFIPNTFTPNGDGVNDRFYVSGIGLGRVTKMAIYNRWGELVYDGGGKANDPGAGWDGTYSGQVLSPDVFVYVVEVECFTGEKFNFRGDITLIR